MKSFLTGTLLVGAACASPSRFEKRQLGKSAGGSGGSSGGPAALLVGGLLNAGYGRVAAPAGAAPVRTVMPPRVVDLKNSKTVKIRHGPYKIPNMSKKNILGEEGALWNYPDKAIDKPCEECMIVGINAGLENPDGSNANIDQGLWLHHMVHMVIGPGRNDPTCMNQGGRSLPHMLLGSTPTGSERFFSSGNERTPAFMAQWTGRNDVGYQLKKTDKFAFIVDLMNENMEDKLAYLTLTYDYVEGTPSGFTQIKPVWFDAAQCGTSEVPAPKQNGSFVISARPWVANFNGEPLGAAGHLHDGGIDVTLEVNKKVVCTSTASYGGDPQFINKPGTGMAAMAAKAGGHGGAPGAAAGGHGHGASEHISKMTTCMTGKDFNIKTVERGQSWVLKAKYDYDKFPGMLHGDGKQSSVMGIAIMYVAIKPGETIGSGGGGAPAAGAAPAGAAAPTQPKKSAKGAKTGTRQGRRSVEEVEYDAEAVQRAIRDWQPDTEYPKFEILS